jgi:mycofactocin system creatininase family protein
VNQLGSLVSGDLADTRQLLVVPLGATEQHGPHLPLGTDTEIATALAGRLAARMPEVVVAPALPYGSSGEHQDFPGTISIGRQAMETLLVELVRSATETFPRTLLLSAHGGNAVVVARAVRRLRAEGRDVLAWGPAGAWNRPELSGDAHAGHTETSVMLALAPDTVTMSRAEVGDTRPITELLDDLVRSGVRAVSDNGVLGDPTGATAQEGQRLLAVAAGALESFVTGWPALAAAAP